MKIWNSQNHYNKINKSLFTNLELFLKCAESKNFVSMTHLDFESCIQKNNFFEQCHKITTLTADFVVCLWSKTFFFHTDTKKILLLEVSCIVPKSLNPNFQPPGVKNENPHFYLIATLRLNNWEILIINWENEYNIKW